MSIHWPIIRRLLASPRRKIITDDRRTWTAGELLVGAKHLASEIERRSTSRTVATLLPTSGAFPMAALAAWIAGRVVVPLNYLLKRDELQYVIEHCETDLIITAQALLDHLGYTPGQGEKPVRLLRLEDVDFRGFPEARWPASARDDDLAVLLYTSGTSGKPKGVMLSHGNITSNIEQCRVWAKFDGGHTLLGILPQFHSFGFTVLTMLPLTVGCRAIYAARFVPFRVINLIREHRPTAFVAIPSMYAALLTAKNAEPEAVSSLKYVVSGAEPLPDDVARRFREKFGLTLNEGYGLTETSPVTNWCLPDDFLPHSVGPPLPGVEERIVDLETGRDLPPGREGEIRIKGPNVMQGYFKMPAETAAAFDERGYLRTGDIGRFNSRGHLFITGRLKEMLIVGGENVFPREIEEVINTHPGVHASAVIGAHDAMRGEVPVVFVELEEGASFDEKALRALCREKLAGYKVPDRIVVVEKLPRNATGKILRRELKGMLEAEATASADRSERTS